MRPTSGAKLVMKKWIEELQAQPWSKAKKANDQPAFNWALNKTAGQVCNISVFLFVFVLSIIAYMWLVAFGASELVIVIVIIHEHYYH